MDQESKGTIKWTRLSFRTLAANAPRLQLDALAYNPGNVMRTSALLMTAEPRSLIDLREKLIKIGAKVVGPILRSKWQAAVSGRLFAEILSLVERRGHNPCRKALGQITTGDGRRGTP